MEGHEDHIDETLRKVEMDGVGRKLADLTERYVFQSGTERAIEALSGHPDIEDVVVDGGVVHIQLAPEVERVTMDFVARPELGGDA